MKIDWNEMKNYVALAASVVTLITFFVGYYEKSK